MFHSRHVDRFPRRMRALTLRCVVIFTLATNVDVIAQALDDITIDGLQELASEIEADNSLQAEVKQQVLELTKKALNHLEAAEAFRATRQQYVSIASDAPTQIKALKQDLVDTPSESESIESAPSPADANTDVTELEQALLAARSELATRQTTLSKAEEQLETTVSSLPQARERLPEAERELAEIAATTEPLQTVEETPELALARARLTIAHTVALNAEIAALKQAMATYPARLEFREVQRNALLRQVDQEKKRVRQLEDTINQRRLFEAEAVKAAAEATREDTAGKHPVLQEWANKNAELGAELKKVAAERTRLTTLVEETTTNVTRLEENFDNTKRKLDVAGLSETVGQALRDRRRTLPDVRSFEREAAQRGIEMAEVGLQQIRLREERQALTPLSAMIEEILARLDAKQSPEFVAELRALLTTRLQLIEKAATALEGYAQALAELDFGQRRLIEVSNRYGAFLDERLLWIRSSIPPSFEALQGLPDELVVLLSPKNWLEAAMALYRGLLAGPYWLLAMGTFFYLLWRRSNVIAELGKTAAYLGKPKSDRLAFTWRALYLTIAAALPWPILFASLGWTIRLSPLSSEFTLAVGHGLTWMSFQVFLLEFFRTLCHPRGMGIVHFRWPAQSLSFLRRTIVQVTPVLVVAGFVTVFFMNLSHSGFAGTLSFVVIELVLAWFFYRILNPKGRVLGNYANKLPNSLIIRVRLLWFPFIVLFPLVLAGYAIMGYLYTSGVLTGRLVQSLWLVLALIVVYSIAVRWLWVTRRKLAYEAALERRAAALKAAESEERSEGTSSDIEDLRSDIEVPQVDLAALDIQTRKLLSLGVILSAVGGLWWIWSSIIPAFGILDNVQLWQHTVDMGGEASLAPITLGDLILAILIGVITVILVKSLPSFFEVVLLQRFNVSPGSRYAISTLSGYAIAAIGILWAINTVGADWSKLQWLVAALGVGIGFGLQEIVANFISGLIILFEQPIRVGDVVTVGDTDGIVSRIQIRATTIRNWDKKELLVPNKEFITGRLLNWTLSDQVNRILINIGVAYGSDVELALKLLDQVAQEHPLIVDDPQPLVIFEGFGDNALNLSLRCYIASLDFRLATMSDLNRAINRKFNDAGIGIPFPQRDVHLDTTQPLDIRIQRPPVIDD